MCCSCVSFLFRGREVAARPIVALITEGEYMHTHIILCVVCLFFLFQFKKSGKEPKAAAELVLGNTTYKTKVSE